MVNEKSNPSAFAGKNGVSRRCNKMKSRDIREFIYKEDLSNDYCQSVVEALKAVDAIALFGAGLGGRRTYDFLEQHGLNERIVCFIDNNPRKQGRDLIIGRREPIPVISIDNFLKLRLADYLIVVSCSEGDEIRSQCEDYGIPDEKVMIPDLAMLNTVETDHQFIWSHIDDFNALYQLLADDWSRSTLVNILNYKISRDMQLIGQIYDSSSNQYFDRELICFSGSEIFIDCGSYIGDTVDSLLSKYRFNNGEIFCFETDIDNYTILKRHISELEKNIGFKGHCYNLAVWSKVDTLHFNAIGSESGFVDPMGSIEIPAKPLDVLLKNKKVDFIKMDIEGAEINALAGAFHIIQEYKPVLAISVYHKPEHLFQIPMLIKAFEPDYKLYLRHYRQCSANDTICYAIPQHRAI